MADLGMMAEPDLMAGVLGDLDPATAATSLKITVSCDGRPVVMVSFPAYAVFNLADLVPDEVRPRVVASSLDLEQIATSHAARGCPPGELFVLPGPTHEVRAWME